MPTEPGILACWKVLEAAGLKRPWSAKASTENGLAVWAAVLGDVPDERLQALTVGYLRSERGRYWPIPGELLHALGDGDAVDDADDAWSEALGLLAWRGRDRCPSTPAELEDLRSRLRATYALAREQGDVDRMDRIQRIGARLPREDAERTEALFAGVRACGGWRALGMADEDAMVAHRAAFRGAYRGQRQRRRLTATEQRVAELVGDRMRMLPGGAA